MEKSGIIILTNDDLTEYNQGKVSKRIEETWGVSYEELRNYIENNNYRIIDNGKSGSTQEINRESTERG